MRVHASATDFVSSWTGNRTHPEAAKHWPKNHDRASQASSFDSKRLGLQVVQIHVVGLKAPRARPQVLGFHAQVAQQMDELVDVDNVWQVVDGHGLRREQHGAKDLQRLVLGTLGDDLPLQAVPALNDETSHAPEFRRSRHAVPATSPGFSTPTGGLHRRFFFFLCGRASASLVFRTLRRMSAEPSSSVPSGTTRVPPDNFFNSSTITASSTVFLFHVKK